MFESFYVRRVLKVYRNDFNTLSPADPSSCFRKSPRFTALLIRALRSKHPDQRAAAARVLGLLQDSAAVEPLIFALEDKNDWVRYRAAEALQAFHDPRIARHLLSAVEDASDRVRAAAAKALGEIREPNAVGPLIKALGIKEDIVYMRGTMIETLGIHEIEVCAGARAEIIRALGKINDARSEDMLIAALDDKDRYVQETAAEALGHLADTRAIDPLIRALGSPVDNVRKCALNSLSMLGEAKWKQIMNSEYYLNNLTRLGRSGDPRSFEPLMKAFETKDTKRRKIVAQAFADLGDPRAVQPLAQAVLENRAYIEEVLHCTDYDEWTEKVERGEAFFLCESLEGFRDPRALEALMAHSQSSDVFVSSAVKRSLEKLIFNLGMPEHDFLLQALGSENADIRTSAIRVLEELGKKA